VFSAIHPATVVSGVSKNRVRCAGLTLVEMLIAISITLVMMGTVVSVFATVSSSVQKRRAVIEVSTQLRHVRNVLQRDLDGATCPLLPWQRPESNHGYFEIIEGLHSDFYPSMLTDGIGDPLTDDNSNNPEIDHAASTIPASSLDFTSVAGRSDWVTDGGGLGDYDDILAFTTRSESEPFSGPAPSNNVDSSNNNQRLFGSWQSEAVKSPVAEVVWYCIENPKADTDKFFGEPGFRTIYRRVLLVAPWIDYRYNIAGSGPKSRPGVLRVLPDSIDASGVDEALASLIAFQERYDISARIEFDPTIGTDGRWTLAANTLADLTKRENRYEHHGFVAGSGRQFPFVMASAGGNATSNVNFVVDPEYGNNNAGGANAEPRTEGNAIVRYDVTDPGADNFVRPLAILEGGATARAMINEAGEVIHVTTGLVPLGRTGGATSRRGEDLMMSDVLGFDVQVFDPEAPVFAVHANGNVLQAGQGDLDVTAVGPGSAGWSTAAISGLQVSQGAYVDLGYDELHRRVFSVTTPSTLTTPFAGFAHPKSQLRDARLTRVYDTWSFHYENDGVNQDNDLDASGNPAIDEGTNGFDNLGDYADGRFVRLGVDDPGERETSPPYPSPLRAIQVKLRVYEPDSRQPREVTVRQHFVPE